MTARSLQAIYGTGAYAGMKSGRASIGGDAIEDACGVRLFDPG